jgi:2-oxoglutarate ferredoxin oxidoreductase subunit alpha
MNSTVTLDPPVAKATRAPQSIAEHIVEVISDSGEGAQRCGQSLAAIAARMGNGIWTTEIIPAEIQPPARSVAGASGIRIRMGSQRVTNGGDQTDLVVAFNEQVLIGRVQAKELKPGATSCWRACGASPRPGGRRFATPARSRPCARTATRCTRCRWKTAARNS